VERGSGDTAAPFPIWPPRRGHGRCTIWLSGAATTSTPRHRRSPAVDVNSDTWRREALGRAGGRACRLPVDVTVPSATTGTTSACVAGCCLRPPPRASGMVRWSCVGVGRGWQGGGKVATVLCDERRPSCLRHSGLRGHFRLHDLRCRSCRPATTMAAAISTCCRTAGAASTGRPLTFLRPSGYPRAAAARCDDLCWRRCQWPQGGRRGPCWRRLCTLEGVTPCGSGVSLSTDFGSRSSVGGGQGRTGRSFS